MRFDVDTPNPNPLRVVAWDIQSVCNLNDQSYQIQNLISNYFQPAPFYSTLFCEKTFLILVRINQSINDGEVHPWRRSEGIRHREMPRS